MIKAKFNSYHSRIKRMANATTNISEQVPPSADNRDFHYTKLYQPDIALKFKWLLTNHTYLEINFARVRD